MIVAGAISLLNVAVIAVLTNTPVVGPGLVVAGMVLVTVGRVISASRPVVKVHVKALASGRPIVSLAAVVTVAVQSATAGRTLAGTVAGTVAGSVSVIKLPVAR